MLSNRYYLVFNLDVSLSDMLSRNTKSKKNLLILLNSAFDFALFLDENNISYTVELIVDEKLSDDILQFYLDSDNHAIFSFTKSSSWSCE